MVQGILNKLDVSCKELNLELAPPCPKFDNAFDSSKFGKVSGIIFDNRNLSWRLPADKIESTLNIIAQIIYSQRVDTLAMQCLMGKLNHVPQVYPFLNCSKHLLNMDLAKSIQEESGNFV
jgi:hypothetical protein